MTVKCVVAAVVACGVLSISAAAQTGRDAQPLAAAGATAVVPPAGYVIGAPDILSIVFWREQGMSVDVTVRPDGKITLPLLGDIQAAGYTPEELSLHAEKVAAKYIEDPDATVIVKEIRSRRVFVIGEVGKQGAVPLTSDMTVLQLIAEAGGLLEHANRGDIAIVRQENGRERRFKFNYDDVIKGKKLEQNILLKPGDTIVVR